MVAPTLLLMPVCAPVVSGQAFNRLSMPTRRSMASFSAQWPNISTWLCDFVPCTMAVLPGGGPMNGRCCQRKPSESRSSEYEKVEYSLYRNDELTVVPVSSTNGWPPNVWTAYSFR